MTKDISFGTWLRKQRRSQDLTRQTLANKVGCAEITLRRIENDTLKPSKELALILLEQLGIPEIDRPQWIQYARGLTEYPGQLISSSPTKPPTNLPSLLTTFVGREKEQAEVIQHLNKYRLVTLTGSGGVGKTRLSIKVGEQLLENYSNGIWLLELSALTEPVLLTQTVIAMLGLVTQSNNPPVEVLINFLHEKNILLILDNCEHLLEACAQLVDTLLKNCPKLKILTTSREALGISGEVSYRVPSLRLPNVQESFESLRSCEAVRLFEERARLSRVDFILNSENASSVARICSRLDGIPLALELAAANINSFSTTEIAEQLEKSFNLLIGGSRTGLPRQQTIRASINWSWDLLTGSERTFMQQLSVFAGGWTLESAQAVCDGDVLGLTTSLVKKSLIMVKEEAGHMTRYRFHEIVHQYAREKMVNSGDEETNRSLHLKYFFELAEHIEPALHGPQQKEWFTRLNDELGNIRVALEYASRTNLEMGLLLSASLTQYWENIDLREGLDWINEFVQKPESKKYQRGRAKALLSQGNILWYLQKFDDARSPAEESIALFRACGDQQGEFDGLILMGIVMQYLEGMDQKIEIQKQALVLAESIGDIWRQAIALSALGWDQREPRKSRENWEKAISLFRREGDWRNLAFTLGILGYTVLSNGEMESAQKYLDESLELNQRINNRKGLEFVLTGKSYMALTRGEYGQARAYIQEWMALAQELGNRMAYLWSRARFGYILLREGNLVEAHQILVETAESFYEDRNMSGLVYTLEMMTGVHALSNKPEIAAHLIGWSDTTRKKIGDPRPRLEQDGINQNISVISKKIGKSAFENNYNKGCGLTLDEVVRHAIE